MFAQIAQIYCYYSAIKMIIQPDQQESCANRQNEQNQPGKCIQPVFLSYLFGKRAAQTAPFNGLTREVPYGQARFIQQNTCFVVCTFFIATVGPFKCLYMQCAMPMRKSPARASDGSFRRIRGDGWTSPRHSQGSRSPLRRHRCASRAGGDSATAPAPKSP